MHAGGKLKNYENFYDATFKTALAGDFTGGNCHYNSVCVHSSPIELSKQAHRSHPQRPGTFNYPLNQSAYSVFGYMYEGLINENGLTSKLEPGLAESWEVSKDGKKIVFTLREGLKWSDGEPMTTDDIIFSYEKIYFNDKIPSGLKDTLRVGMQSRIPKS